MPTLWTKIGVGAVGVFATGMLGLTLFKEAAAATGQVVAHALHGTIEGVAGAAMKELAFRLEGERLGTLRQLSVHRVRHGDLPELAIEVELDQLASMKRLAMCDLVPASRGGSQDFDPAQGFRCAERHERPLIGIGTAHFLPGDIVRPILVSRAQEAELRQGEPFHATADLNEGIRVTATDGNGELVKVFADSSGASIHVRDGRGHSLVRLIADSDGATLRVRGKDGRDVVRLDAGNGTFSLTVDSSASP